MRPMATSGRLDVNLLGSDIRNRISHALSAAACLYTVILLIGWWFRIGWVLRVIPELLPIHQHTAATFLGLSFAVMLSPWRRRWQQRAAMSLAVLAVAVGSIRIVATLTGRSLWIGDPSSTDGTVAVALNTATVFVCRGIACLCMMPPRARTWNVGILLASVAFAVGCLTLFGRLFQASAMYAAAGQVMTLPAAILAVLTSTALLASRPPIGMVGLTLDRAASRWFNLPIRYKCMGVLALPIACLTFDIAWQLQVLRGLEDAQGRTTHTQQVELTVGELQQTLLQIETNDRGYGLSGNEEFLVPLSQLEPHVLEVTRRLSHLVEDNPQQLQRLRNLEALIRIKLGVARDVTEFFSTHPMQTRSPQISLRLLESKTSMDQFMELS